MTAGVERLLLHCFCLSFDLECRRVSVGGNRKDP